MTQLERFKLALEQIEDGTHDEGCEGGSDTRSDCWADHRCYCAARIARKVLLESKDLDPGTS